MFNPDYTSEIYPFTEETPENEILDQYIFTPQKWKIRAVGLFLHRTQSRLGNRPHLWETLAAMPDLLIVSLHRRNLLRRYLSFELRPRRSRPIPPSGKVLIDRHRLMEDFQHQKAKVDEFDRFFRDHPVFTVCYEDLCANWDGTMRGLQRFLDVPFRRVQPETPKLITETLPERIDNYAELQRELADTEWAGFFED